MRSIILLLCLIFFAAAYPQSLSPEQERLSFLVGKWTVEGSEDTYLEVCTRIQGNHIQCISSSENGDIKDSSVSYLSWLSLEKSYVYYGLYSTGSSRTLRGRWENDRFIFEGERSLPDKKTKTRVTLIPEPGKMKFIEESAVNDGAFEKKTEFYYIKLD